jgi:hypothetical protein
VDVVSTGHTKDELNLCILLLEYSHACGAAGGGGDVGGAGNTEH